MNRKKARKHRFDRWNRIRALGSHLLPAAGGTLLFALGYNSFLLPLGIVLGGAAGIGSTLYTLLGFPAGVTIFLINVPLILAEGWLGGWRRVAPSLGGILLTSAAADAFSFLPLLTEDPLMAGLLGGAAMGAGVGLLLSVGLTTGGTDLAAELLCRLFHRFSVGKIILVLDGLVVLFSAVALQSFSGILISCASIVAYSIALDAAQNGIAGAKCALIVTARANAVAARMSADVGRGITVLYGEGYYSGEGRRVLVCAFRRGEMYRLRRAVLSVDRDAFFIIAPLSQVVGEGFLPPEGE